MVEMVDTQDLKSCSSDRVRVRVSLGAFSYSPMVERQTVNLYVVGSIPTGAVYNGVSPSGKATDSDSVIRRFESCYPSFESLKRLSFFMRLSQCEKFKAIGG